jgi:hypothetical protein
VAGSCEHGYEPSDSITDGNIYLLAERLTACQEGI